jgi:hypothetical protein
LAIGDHVVFHRLVHARGHRVVGATAMTRLGDDRRTQRIGRREIDLWREHQIARCEQQRTRLEALEREMKIPANNVQATGIKLYWAKRLTAILNDAPEAAILNDAPEPPQ